MSGSSSPRVLGLDGIRALAALAVFAHHALPGQVQHLGLGSLGVRTFFVLSGFVIVRGLHAQRYAIEAGALTVGQALRTFWRRRVLRVFPLYYLTVIGFVAVAGLPRARMLCDAVFATNLYFEHTETWGAAHTSYLWSLCVEEQFYVLAAPALLLSTRSKHALGLLGASAAGVVAFTAYVWSGAPVLPIYVSPFANAPYFTAGGLIAVARIPRLPMWSAAVCLVSPLLAARFHDAGYPRWFCTDWTLCLVGCAALIAATVQHQDSASVRALERLRGLGTISYGVYMLHEWVLRVPSPWADGWLASLWVPLQFAATLVLAALSWRLIERPIQSYRGTVSTLTRSPIGLALKS